mgnify:CR=1 FL=1
MGRRLEFDAVLRTMVPNVYFQPPGDIDMQFPCIVYQRDGDKTEYADNAPYFSRQRYQVTVIHSDVDNTIREAVAAMPMSSFRRFFTANHLNHDVYSVFF